MDFKYQPPVYNTRFLCGDGDLEISFNVTRVPSKGERVYIRGNQYVVANVTTYLRASGPEGCSWVVELELV